VVAAERELQVLQLCSEAVTFLIFRDFRRPNNLSISSTSRPLRLRGTTEPPCERLSSRQDRQAEYARWLSGFERRCSVLLRSGAAYLVKPR
jgi:hypothetical protein